MVRRAQTLLGNKAEAQDVAHEVFVALIESPEQFRGESAAMTYLFAIATKLAITRLRKRIVRDEAWEEAVATMWTFAIPPVDPSAATEAHQLVSRALKSADETTTLIVLGHCFDGLTQDEVAQTVGLSRVTVNQRLLAFRANLAGGRQPQ